ncbi:MAG TPA: alkaline phosphatase family protein [Tepidisphaeraceae bacterium]|nr:alkaline phosphatase family protein [Tepidisphaeraceae bacterium]
MLCIVVLLAALGPLLIQDGSPRLPTSVPQVESERATRVALVVIDALRLDAARDPARMPNLHALAERHAWGIARVEAAVPSTIAGITTFITGRVPGPTSFLLDFGAPVAADGGVLQAFRDSGRDTFVAGPRLWHDRYRPWISRSHLTNRIGDDDGILSAGLAAIADARNDLVIIHLSQGDEVAHLFGATSANYAAFVARADASVARIAAIAPPDMAVVVASDHGVTDFGGHAGPEDAVRNTPLVAWGPGLPRGQMGDVSQAIVPRLITEAAGVAWQPPPQVGTRISPTWLLAFVGILASCAILSGIPHRSRHRGYTLLNNLLWPALVLLGFALFGLAATCALVALLLFARRNRLYRIDLVIAGVLAFGAMVGLLRWWIGLASLDGSPLRSWPLGASVAVLFGGLLMIGLLRFGWPSGLSNIGRLQMADLLPLATPGLAYLVSGPPLAAACAVGVATGWAARLALRRSATAQWVVILIAVPLLTALGGQGLSLSTINVRVAFAMLDSWAGPIAALGVVMAVQVLPIAAVVMPVATGLTNAPKRQSGTFAAGLMTALIAQAIIGSLLLAIRFHDTRQAAMAVALVSVVIVETLLIAMTAALAAFFSVGRPARTRSHAATSSS